MANGPPFPFNVALVSSVTAFLSPTRLLSFKILPREFRRQISIRFLMPVQTIATRYAKFLPAQGKRYHAPLLNS